MENPRDEIPDYAVRARRMADFYAAPVLPIADVALFLDLPLSTVDKLRAAGKLRRCVQLHQLDHMIPPHRNGFGRDLARDERSPGWRDFELHRLADGHVCLRHRTLPFQMTGRPARIDDVAGRLASLWGLRRVPTTAGLSILCSRFRY